MIKMITSSLNLPLLLKLVLSNMHAVFWASGGERLNGLKPGDQELRTSKEGRKDWNDFVAVVGKAGKNYQKGPKFESYQPRGRGDSFQTSTSMPIC